MLDNFSGNIQSLVDRLGRDITLRTYAQSGPAYDPVLTPTDLTVRAAVFDYEAGEVDGSVIQSNDKEFVISSTVIITKQMKLIDSGTEYNIESLEKVRVGDDTLMFIAQGRA